MMLSMHTDIWCLGDAVPPLLTIDETAELLHLSRRRISAMLSEGRLRGSKITRSGGPGGRRLVLRSSIEALIVQGME